ncbi:hypothetical protein [Mycolicibacterium sp. P1-5]|uniref:hypothetical protein n=1 Tax=Mycolicibacterium sp. P1-5 TaxID=2024617 RepID=UPI0011EEDFA6|nr:hypothetical protein [Mycolicibacterium sp. P1-5]KAA0108068.1 hypothetical protein CIW47_15365 [Mycolicibacterium sp. P1-5]
MNEDDSAATFPERPGVDSAALPLAPVRRDGWAGSARTTVSAPSATAADTEGAGPGVESDDLPLSYYVNTTSDAFLDGSWNFTATGVIGPDGTRDDAEIYVIHATDGNAVAYTRLYLNQTANVRTVGSWSIEAFDPGVFPGSLALTEIPAGPPRRLPNSPSEYGREGLASVLGYIPGVAQVVGTVNLVLDEIELSDAQRRGDIDDIADEKADLETDLVYHILGVQQLQAAIAILTLPVTLPVGIAFFAIYIATVNQCVANPGSEACWAIS